MSVSRGGLSFSLVDVCATARRPGGSICDRRRARDGRRAGLARTRPQSICDGRATGGARVWRPRRPRARSGPTAAGSEQDKRAARVPRPNGFEPLRASSKHTSRCCAAQPAASTCASQGGRSRPPPTALAVLEVLTLSRISLQAAAFCARSLASASKPSKKVPNRHQTQLQHPSSCLNCQLDYAQAELANHPLVSRLPP